MINDKRRLFAYIRDEHFEGDIPEELKNAYLFAITKTLRKR